jgi:catalase
VVDYRLADFERKLPTEDADIEEIVQGILTLQARYATEQKRPLARGTHAKGVCARAQFEIFDVRSTVSDGALATRLARGIYGKPGVYPATVRFANAESHVYADSKPDVRAMSFSVDLPPGLVGPAAARQDYAMNNATTFPINDAHAFAALLKVVTASNTFKGILSLPFSDRLRFVRLAVLGTLQKRNSVRPFQQMRYWSTTPFRHGSDDAVKYSAIPSAGNPAQAVQHHDPNGLQDELMRHLNEDSRMSTFDFGLQLLDAGKLTCWGRRRDSTFWIENASIEWHEAEAPFHIVGRLTLLPRSHVAAEVCEAMHIDVTQHSTADTSPLGSINRARWAAESASRRARLGTEETTT